MGKIRQNMKSLKKIKKKKLFFLNFKNIKIIYITPKGQCWGICSKGIKKCLVKKKVNFMNLKDFLQNKKVISYKNSKLFKKGVSFDFDSRGVLLIRKDKITLVNVLNKNMSIDTFLSNDLSLNKCCFLHKQQFTFMDLFSGMGGLSTGFIKTGFMPLLFVDSDKDSCETLKLNHSDISVIHNKLNNVDLVKFKHKVDVLLAGPPCQSFSEIGLRAGLSDENGMALLDLIKSIFILRPRVFIIENVRGLCTHGKGKTFEHILSLLSRDNIYKVEHMCINMVDYGIPQKRIRLFIVGSLFDLNINLFPLPKIYKKQTLGDVLVDVPDSEGAKYSLFKRSMFKLIPQGGCWVDLPQDLQKSYLGKSFNSNGGKRGILKRLSFDEASLTLLCSPSQKQTERCHPIENRPLTIKEYGRIQTFPDDYKLYGSISSRYKQIGNAVPPKFSYQLALSISRQLNNFRSMFKRQYSSRVDKGGISFAYKLKLKKILTYYLEQEEPAWWEKNKNKQVVDCLLDRFSLEERSIHLKIHRASMLHGKLWESVFKLETGYTLVKKLDLKNESKKEFIELKNKSTSLNSDSKSSVYSKLALFSELNPEWTCILGFINDFQPMKKVIYINNQRILVLSSDYLFEHILGDNWFEIRQYIIEFCKNYKK